MDEGINKKLSDALELSIIKDGEPRIASIALSDSGEEYIAGSISSDTHLLHISSEQAALLKAVANNDYSISKVISMTECVETPVSPLALKTLIDFERRTGTLLSYTLFGADGSELFSQERVGLDFYKPKIVPLSITKNRELGVGSIEFDKAPSPEELKEYALLGADKSFLSNDGATPYGAAILTKENIVFYGGQFSSFERRTGLHAEMTPVIRALMSGQRDIVSLGVVSTKSTDKPCSICGFCRQFLYEMSTRFGWDLTVYSFAAEADTTKVYTVEELLPDPWTSKKWQQV